VRKTHLYSEDEKQFLKINVTGKSYQEITDLFNARFGLDLSSKTIGGALKRYDLKNGRNGCFTKGHEPANKGIKGTHCSQTTEFRKGHVPANYKPIGTEQLKSDGYIWVKVAEPNIWKQKHRIMWEKANGKLEAGSRLIFADGDHSNTNLDNLILLTQAELLTANRQGLLYKDPDLTRTGTIVAKVITKAWEVKHDQT